MPSPLQQRFIDLLAMGRVANLPSVISNVCLGAGLGIFTGNFYTEPTVIILPVLSGCLLYLGGCFLNDWSDAAWDQEHRPERAVPAGRMHRKPLGLLSAILLFAGVVLAGLVNLPALFAAAGIATAIVIYTWLHKKTAWAILPMGICRALLYVLGFVAQSLPHYYGDAMITSNPNFSHDTYYATTLFGLVTFPANLATIEFLSRVQVLLPTALGLMAYVAGLSLMARFESRGILHRSYLIIGLGLIFLPAFLHSAAWMPTIPLANILSLLPFLGIATLGAVLIRGNVPRGVGIFLAGIPLVDLIAALPLAVAFWGTPLSAAAHHPQAILFPAVSVAAFLLALLLQKIAPAT